MTPDQITALANEAKQLMLDAATPVQFVREAHEREQDFASGARKIITPLADLVLSLQAENQRMREALTDLLASEIYADAEGVLSVKSGGMDDKEHREIVSRCEAALAASGKTP